MTKKNYKHLSEAGRLKIYALLFEGHSLQKIAESISRFKSTIYRELPSELLYQVGIYFSPSDILNLIKSNKEF